MPISDVVGEIDKEVARLLAAKKLLTGGVVKTGRSGRGHTIAPQHAGRSHRLSGRAGQKKKVRNN